MSVGPKSHCKHGHEFTEANTYRWKNHRACRTCNRLSVLKAERAKGALPRKDHGYWGTPTYRSWVQMRTRCNNPKVAEYARYGGRGIIVCAQWNLFESFLADMGERPIRTSLDRHPDNNGNYQPGNCRWATSIEQQNNRRSNRLITAFGKTQTMAEWAREKGIDYRSLKTRLRIGMSVEAALTAPKMRGGWGLSREKAA